MKHPLFLKHSSLCLLLCLLCACTGTDPEWSEQYKEATLTVVKFSPTQTTEWSGNVMLAPDANGVYTMRKLSNGGTCREFIIGKNPLSRVGDPQAWFLADWKWGLNLSYVHAVLALRWEDVRRPDDTYVKSDFTAVNNNIIWQYGYVKRSDIDKFLGIQPAPAADTPGPWGFSSHGISTDHLAPVYLSRYFSSQDIPDVIDKKGNWQYTKSDFLAERLRQDSLQEVYRTRLKQVLSTYQGEQIIQIAK